MLARKFLPPNTETSTPHCLLHYRLSGSEQPIIFRSGLLGKERNSNNPHGVIGLRYVRKRTL
jgi:hypothetical protein